VTTHPRTEVGAGEALHVRRKTTRFGPSALILAALLAACGGGSAGSATIAPSAPAASGAAAAQPASASSSPATQAIASSKPAAAPTSGGAASAAAGSDWQATWDRTLAAAKQEGKVAVEVNPPIDVYRPLYDAFQKKYGITVDLIAFSGSADLVPRLKAERDAGQYNWDVIVHAPITLFAGAKPLGALDPLRPALILPEALDDSKWFKGFEAGWYDSGKSLAYSFVGYLFFNTYVNRQVVSPAQFSKIDQLWDPQWKGKIAIQDPRVPSAGSAGTATWLAAKGEDKLRAFFRDQQPVLTQDKRQLAEWVVRGQYPIGVGLSESQMSQFKSSGLPVDSVQAIDDGDRAAADYSSGSGAVGLFNRAPHPNAARVLINWLLTAEAQKIYSELSGFNSRRLDVPVVSASQRADPAKDYINVENEDGAATYQRAIAIGKELLK